jgi:hypothetical protein
MEPVISLHSFSKVLTQRSST